MHNYLEGGCNKGRAILCSVVLTDRTRGNGHKSKYRRLCPSIGKNVFTVRVTEHWHRLLREVAESSSWIYSKNHLDMLALGGHSCAGGLDQMTSEVTSNLSHSVIL